VFSESFGHKSQQFFLDVKWNLFQHYLWNVKRSDINPLQTTTKNITV